MDPQKAYSVYKPQFQAQARDVIRFLGVLAEILESRGDEYNWHYVFTTMEIVQKMADLPYERMPEDSKWNQNEEN